LALIKITEERTRQKSIINIVFLGDKCVGKTSLVFKSTTSEFDHFYNQTIAQEELSKSVKIEGKNYSLNIIVTSACQNTKRTIPNYTQKLIFWWFALI
jgi:GTPase SAR1 family protein